MPGPLAPIWIAVQFWEGHCLGLVSYFFRTYVFFFFFFLYNKENSSSDCGEDSTAIQSVPGENKTNSNNHAVLKETRL